ncbi:hypothetical protein AB0E59_41370 [Lentzea sp. NPDC034063]|uniref:WXG100-like domain-containing protein n=1 Tax=unclassified Lentzea TaxID=2643253 RepID=UPI0033CF93EA
MAVHGNMTVPPELNWIFIILAGGDWPPGMEGDAWQIYEALLEIADDLDGSVGNLAVALRDVMGHVDSTVGRAFWRYGEKLAQLPADYALGARELAGMARDFSLNVQGAKISTIIMMIYTAFELLMLLYNPFTAPAAPAFVKAMQDFVSTILKHLRAWMKQAGDVIASAAARLAGRKLDDVVVPKLADDVVHQVGGKTVSAVAKSAGLDLDRLARLTPADVVGSIVYHMGKEALDEGFEEVVQDGIVQVWQNIESDKAWNWQSTVDSFKYGAAAGAFAGLLRGGVMVFRPGWAGHWVTAGGIGGATEVFVGAITIPAGGDPGDIWKGMVNGVVTGAGMAALHSWKNDPRLGQDGPGKPGRITVDTGTGSGSAGGAPPGYDDKPGYGGMAGDGGGEFDEWLPAYAAGNAGQGTPPPAYTATTGPAATGVTGPAAVIGGVGGGTRAFQGPSSASTPVTSGAQAHSSSGTPGSSSGMPGTQGSAGERDERAGVSSSSFSSSVVEPVVSAPVVPAPVVSASGPVVSVAGPSLQGRDVSAGLAGVSPVSSGVVAAGPVSTSVAGAPSTGGVTGSGRVSSGPVSRGDVEAAGVVPVDRVGVVGPGAGLAGGSGGSGGSGVGVLGGSAGGLEVAFERGSVTSGGDVAAGDGAAGSRAAGVDAGVLADGGDTDVTVKPGAGSGHGLPPGARSGRLTGPVRGSSSRRVGPLSPAEFRYTKLRDRSGALVGVSFLAGDEFDRVTQWVSASERTHSVSVDIDYQKYAGLPPEKRVSHRRESVAPWEWGRDGKSKTFFVDAHGDGSSVTVTKTDGSAVRLSGGELARFVVSTFRLTEDFSVTLISCSAGAQSAGDALVRDFLHGADPVNVVHAPTAPVVPVGDAYGDLPELAGKMTIFEGGSWVTASAHKEVVDAVLAAVVPAMSGDRRREFPGRFSEKRKDHLQSNVLKVVAHLQAGIRRDGTLDLSSLDRIELDSLSVADVRAYVVPAALRILASGPPASSVRHVKTRISRNTAGTVLDLTPQSRLSYNAYGQAEVEQFQGREYTWRAHMVPGEGDRDSLIKNIAVLAAHVRPDGRRPSRDFSGLSHDEWLEGLAWSTKQAVDFLLERIAVNGGAIDLMGLSRMIDTRFLGVEADVREYVVPAALHSLALTTDNEYVNTVVDIYKDAQSGKWKRVELDRRARARYGVTGNGRWDDEAGVVRRPMRLIRVGEFESNRFSNADADSQAFRVTIDPKIYARDHIPFSEESEKLDEVTLAVVRIALEHHFDDVSLPVFQVTSSAHEAIDRYRSSWRTKKFVENGPLKRAVAAAEELRARFWFPARRIAGEEIGEKLDGKSIILVPREGGQLPGDRGKPYVRIEKLPDPLIPSYRPYRGFVGQAPGARATADEVLERYGVAALLAATPMDDTSREMYLTQLRADFEHTRDAHGEDAAESMVQNAANQVRQSSQTLGTEATGNEQAFAAHGLSRSSGHESMTTPSTGDGRTAYPARATAATTASATTAGKRSGSGENQGPGGSRSGQNNTDTGQQNPARNRKRPNPTDNPAQPPAKKSHTSTRITDAEWAKVLEKAKERNELPNLINDKRGLPPTGYTVLVGGRNVALGSRLGRLNRGALKNVGGNERQALIDAGYGYLIPVEPGFSGVTLWQERGLVRAGLRWVDVAADGDCFMHAVIRTAGLVDEQGRALSASSLRRRLADALRADALRADLLLPAGHRRIWGEVLDSDVAQLEVAGPAGSGGAGSGDVDMAGLEDAGAGPTAAQRERFIALVQSDGFYAHDLGDHIPYIAARALGVVIRVHNHDGSVTEPVPAAEASSAGVIDLVYLGGARGEGVDHWLATEPVGASGGPDGLLRRDGMRHDEHPVYLPEPVEVSGNGLSSEQVFRLKTVVGRLVEGLDFERAGLERADSSGEADASGEIISVDNRLLVRVSGTEFGVGGQARIVRDWLVDELARQLRPRAGARSEWIAQALVGVEIVHHPGQDGGGIEVLELLTSYWFSRTSMSADVEVVAVPGTTRSWDVLLPVNQDWHDSVLTPWRSRFTDMIDTVATLLTRKDKRKDRTVTVEGAASTPHAAIVAAELTEWAREQADQPKRLLNVRVGPLPAHTRPDNVSDLQWRLYRVRITISTPATSGPAGAPVPRPHTGDETDTAPTPAVTSRHGEHTPHPPPGPIFAHSHTGPQLTFNHQPDPTTDDEHEHQRWPSPLPGQGPAEPNPNSTAPNTLWQNHTGLDHTGQHFTGMDLTDMDLASGFFLDPAVISGAGPHPHAVPVDPPVQDLAAFASSQHYPLQALGDDLTRGDLTSGGNVDGVETVVADAAADGFTPTTLAPMLVDLRRAPGDRVVDTGDMPHRVDVQAVLLDPNGTVAVDALPMTPEPASELAGVAQPSGFRSDGEWPTSVARSAPPGARSSSDPPPAYGDTASTNVSLVPTGDRRGSAQGPTYSREPEPNYRPLLDRRGVVIGVSFMTGQELARAQQWARSEVADRNTSLLVDTDYGSFAAMSPAERQRHIREVKGPWTGDTGRRKTFFVDVHGDGSLASVTYSDGSVRRLTGRQLARLIRDLRVFRESWTYSSVTLISCAVSSTPGDNALALGFYEGILSSVSLVVHAPTGPIVPVGNTYTIDGMGHRTAIFDRGVWTTVGNAQVRLGKVMRQMGVDSSRPLSHDLEFGGDEWIASVASHADRWVKFLADGVERDGTLDLVGVTSALPFSPNAADFVWLAALYSLADSPLAARVTRVIDAERRRGAWYGLNPPKDARSRYVVTGKAEWDQTAGVLVRPARLVPVAAYEHPRTSGTEVVSDLVLFEHKKGEIDLNSTSLEPFRQLARKVAELAFEHHIDNVSLPVLDVVGYGRGKLLMAGAGREKGLERGTFAANFLRDQVTAHLHQIGGQNLLNEIEVGRIVPVPAAGGHLTGPKSHPFVRATLRPDGRKLSSAPTLAQVSYQPPPGARYSSRDLLDLHGVTQLLATVVPNHEMRNRYTENLLTEVHLEQQKPVPELAVELVRQTGDALELLTAHDLPQSLTSQELTDLVRAVRDFLRRGQPEQAHEHVRGVAATHAPISRRR